jgi:hypothetical protein
MKKKYNIGKFFVYIILIGGVGITVFPFIWMILTSFKSQIESIKIPITIFPKEWLIKNYFAVFKAIPFGRMYLNTIINAVVIVSVQLLFCSMAAYAFARLKFPGKNVIFTVLLSVLMIPSSFFILPQYQIIQGLGLLNSLPALFLPNLFSIFGTFLLRQFFKSLPDSLEDAARIDGCNRFMIYYKIMLPLVKSGLVALGILTLRFAWNDLMWPLIVNTSEQKMTLAAGLSSLQGQYVTDYPLMMAGAVMSVAPLLILFAIFQEQFIEGIALSGVKG